MKSITKKILLLSFFSVASVWAVDDDDMSEKLTHFNNQLAGIAEEQTQANLQVIVEQTRAMVNARIELYTVRMGRFQTHEMRAALVGALLIDLNHIVMLAADRWTQLYNTLNPQGPAQPTFINNILKQLSFGYFAPIQPGSLNDFFYQVFGQNFRLEGENATVFLAIYLKTALHQINPEDIQQFVTLIYPSATDLNNLPERIHAIATSIQTLDGTRHFSVYSPLLFWLGLYQEQHRCMKQKSRYVHFLGQQLNNEPSRLHQAASQNQADVFKWLLEILKASESDASKNDLIQLLTKSRTTNPLTSEDPETQAAIMALLEFLGLRGDEACNAKQFSSFNNDDDDNNDDHPEGGNQGRGSAVPPITVDCSHLFPEVAAGSGAKNSQSGTSASKKAALSLTDSWKLNPQDFENTGDVLGRLTEIVGS